MDNNQGHIHASAELWIENGQWRMVLRAPSWVLGDISRTMHQLTHPQVWVFASSEYREGGIQYLYFTTWNGGALGSEPQSGKTKWLKLVDEDTVITEESLSENGEKGE